MYLIHLSEKYNSVAKIQEAVYSISLTHSLGGLNDPCIPSLVKAVKEGSLRAAAHSVKKKEPITAGILLKLVEKFGKESNSLQDVRISCMCLIAYAVSLRFSELVNLQRSTKR